MANNRMWLVHVPTGKRLLIAKNLGRPWYLSPVIEDRAEGFFEEAFAEGAGVPSEEWKLEFEDGDKHDPVNDV